jgi:hypothetical protein
MSVAAADDGGTAYGYHPQWDSISDTEYFSNDIPKVSLKMMLYLLLRLSRKSHLAVIGRRNDEAIR